MRALVTTTINVPHVLARYRQSMWEEDVVIVVGDRKTPHDSVEALLATLPGDNMYLRPEDQARWKVSEHLGWDCIQRRNVGYLEALERGASLVTTVDDDNWPTDRYFHDVRDRLHAHGARVYETDSGWFNPASQCQPPVVHRGYPYSQRDVHPKLTVTYRDVRVGVVAGLWFGDPDVDATERMVNHPEVTGMTEAARQSFVLAPGTWAPFNSQNTTFVRDLVPAAFCLPHVGRFDDIWASYVTRAVMDRMHMHVSYGPPFVTQERNPHDLVRDLEQEVLGYRHTDELCEVLRETSLPHLDQPWEYIELLYAAMTESCVFLPPRTCDAMEAWLEDVRQATS